MPRDLTRSNATNAPLGSFTHVQEQAIHFLAIGYDELTCARRVGCKLEAIIRWLQEDKFRQAVRDDAENTLRRLEPNIARNLELALDVQKQVLTGELKAKDERALAANRLVDRFLDKLLYVEVPESAPPSTSAPLGDSGSLVPIQININGSSSNGNGAVSTDAEYRSD